MAVSRPHAAGASGGPLAGLRVLDLSRILSGPYCTMLLGDLGADVIKVEPPGGDDTRGWGPPFQGGESAYYLSVNRNKRSIGVNLKTAGGRDVILTLLRQADVVVENFRPGTLERLGLAWNVIHRENPRAILASISGFGQTGPWSREPGYDVLAQAMGGLMTVTGHPGGEPAKAGFSMADLGAGMAACLGILAALHARERTGEGQWVDASLYDTMLSWQTYFATSFFMTGKEPGPTGHGHPNLVPYQAFPSRDGWFILAVGNDALWRKFKDACGFQDPDGRWDTNADRVRDRERLLQALADFFRQRTSAEWIALCREAGIPCGPIARFGEIWSNPHTQARGMRVAMDHPTVGRVEAAGSPVKLSAASRSDHLPPPLLGQHTREVLLEAGFDDDAIAHLIAEGAVFCGVTPANAERDSQGR